MTGQALSIQTRPWRPPAFRAHGWRKADGAALLLVLVVLTGLMLAAAGLVRAVDASSLLAGNLAFQRTALQAADSGAEAAIDWLASSAGSALLDGDLPSVGYYASSAGEWDMSGNQSGASWSRVDWSGKGCPASAACLRPVIVPADAAGNTSGYVVQRLCNSPGSIYTKGNQCQLYRQPGSPDAVYYRVTVRVSGPRNTVSITQTVVRFLG